MKKIFLFVIILSSITILYGCGEKSPQVLYDFENFHGYFDSERYYNLSTSNLKGLGYQLLQNDIITIYKEQYSSGFTNSIIIAKRETDKKVDEFVSENLKLITNDGFKIENNKNSEFQCNGNTIRTNTVNAKIKTNLETIYISQTFFKKNNLIYIISFSTLDIQERDNFSNNIKYIHCE